MMDRRIVSKAVADAVGSPVSGPVADVLDAIVDAVMALGESETAGAVDGVQRRVVKVDETR